MNRYAKIIPSYIDYIKIYENITDLLSDTLPKRKVKHSIRVADYVKELTNKPEVIDAALYHDYLERGGDKESVTNLLGFKTFNLINSMTIDDSVIRILKRSLPTYNDVYRNDLILIKVADRTDNLLTKLKKGEITDKYIRKSGKLLRFLIDSSSLNNKKKIIDFLDIYILNKIPEIQKFIYK